MPASLSSEAPFKRGSTPYEGGTIDTNDLVGVQWEGQEWIFNDVNPHTGVQRTESQVRCRAVRNVSGITLLPGQLVQFSTTAGVYGTRVIGYSNATAGEGYPVDEYLSSTTGCPNNDMCWIVIDGPAVIKTTMAGDAGNLIPVGSWVVAATAAASTHSTTAGRVEVQVLTGATALLANQVQNRVGRALTARTTANTNTDTLYYVGKW